MATPMLYSVEVHSYHEKWPRGTGHYVAGMPDCGIGTRTLEEAHAWGARMAAWAGSQGFRLGAFYRIRQFCDACTGNLGIKPGCKRKRCPVCLGTGTRPLERED